MPRSVTIRSFVAFLCLGILNLTCPPFASIIGTVGAAKARLVPVHIHLGRPLNGHVLEKDAVMDSLLPKRVVA